MKVTLQSWMAVCVALATVAANPRALGGAVGTNHPASGAYSEVNPSGWGTASWARGVTFTSGSGSTMEVGVYSAHATMVVLEIYLSDTGANAKYDYTMTKGSDDVWRAAIADVPNLTLYAFRAWGPNWPYNASWARGNSIAGYVSDCDSSGNRFNPNKVLYDPYAREISHNVITPAFLAAGNGYGMFLSGGGSGEQYSGPTTNDVAIDQRQCDTGEWAPKSVAVIDSTSTGTKPNLAQQNAIIYETHLKGLTAHPSVVNLTTLLSPYSGFQDAANVPNSLRGTYAGAAYMAGYLKDLGFNTVEFLPIQETNNADDPTTAPSTSGGGYWAYWTYGFFAPDRRYASNQAFGGPTAEFKAMVAAFHKKGIEVYLDVVYNHFGEGGTQDASYNEAEIDCFRGLDNASYYTLVPGSPNQYYDTTGCGTNLNAASAPAQQLVTDSLTYWCKTMGVDGFRFDEGDELGRPGAANFSGTSTLLESIASLAQTDSFKIVAEPDDADSEEIGKFPSGWANWNFNYRDSVRLALLGNLNGENGVGYCDAFYGDYNDFNPEGGPQKSVNLITCHDGFNVTDLVSFNSQTNSSLTWPFGPSDGGTSSNNSSNWGLNQQLRRQIIRTFWTFMALSRGVPLVEYGDEFGRTVNGNNNPYDVDSVATWNNYNMIDTNAPDTVATGDQTGGTMAYDNNLGTFAGSTNGNFAFLQYLLQLRAAHVAFRQSNYSSETITYTNPNLSSGFSEWSDAAVQIFVEGTQVGDEDFLVLVNFTNATVNFTLPTPPSGTNWVRLVDTNAWAESSHNCWPAASAAVITGSYGVDNNSIVVLEAYP
ncbi:MAG TPA: alpha-amylase family glycosyl hydrolase [Opitutaceae bacterium]|jgi:glycogen operon protein|nr:alpha-amylase family glycosyl hydrolase [Opitutaceae bacterium]